jgi:hypothetical protein
MDYLTLFILIAVLTGFALIVDFTQPIWGGILQKADGKKSSFILLLVF